MDALPSPLNVTAEPLPVAQDHLASPSPAAAAVAATAGPPPAPVQPRTGVVWAMTQVTTKPPSPVRNDELVEIVVEALKKRVTLFRKTMSSGALSSNTTWIWFVLRDCSARSQQQLIRMTSHECEEQGSRFPKTFVNHVIRNPNLHKSELAQLCQDFRRGMGDTEPPVRSRKRAAPSSNGGAVERLAAAAAAAAEAVKKTKQSTRDKKSYACANGDHPSQHTSKTFSCPFYRWTKFAGDRFPEPFVPLARRLSKEETGSFRERHLERDKRLWLDPSSGIRQYWTEYFNKHPLVRESVGSSATLGIHLPPPPPPPPLVAEPIALPVSDA